jgi:nicotinamidase-related amidase
MTDLNIPVHQSAPSAEQVVGALHALREDLHSKGLGHAVGFGDRAALLIVDMQQGFTDPLSPLGADSPATVEAASQLLDATRTAQLPVFYTVCLAAPETAVWQRKLPANSVLLPNSKWVEVDPRLKPRDEEVVLYKHFASAFFDTELHDHLSGLGIDTLIVSGMTTSGCVRASVVDACSLGYRVLIPREAVADRLDLSHQVSLFDMDLKYGDVISLEETCAHLGESLVKTREGS